MPKQLRVFAYDIRRSSIRKRVSTLIGQEAVRVQQSVYEGRLSAASTQRLFEDAEALLDDGDKLRVYTVPDSALDNCYHHDGMAIDNGGRYWLL